MKTLKLTGLIAAGLVSFAAASSEASYPFDWKKYTQVKTPLVKEKGAIGGCEEDIKSLPEHYKELFSTYCGVTPEGLGKIEVLVKPSTLPVYEAFTGDFDSNDSMVMHLKDLKLLFVTEYEKLPKRRFGKRKFNSKPLYGIYDEEGNEMAGAPGSGINPGDCRKCHSSSGINGQMGKIEN